MFWELPFSERTRSPSRSTFQAGPPTSTVDTTHDPPVSSADHPYHRCWVSKRTIIHTANAKTDRNTEPVVRANQKNRLRRSGVGPRAKLSGTRGPKSDAMLATSKLACTNGEARKDDPPSSAALIND